MVGSAVWRLLVSRGYTNLIGKSSSELDLKSQVNVDEFLNLEKPDVVIDAAARVGGIMANSKFPYNFINENLKIQTNLIDGSLKSGVEKFIFLGSSCIYPKFAKQPIKEEYLLTDSLEPTNEWYAIAKIAGVKSCQAIRSQYNKDFLSLMPTNLYGFHDNFDFESSHVIPALIHKFHKAKSDNDDAVVLWGTGKPKREFLFVDDLADAVVFALENKLSESIYNIGSGKDIKISELAEIIKKIVGYKGKIVWDKAKPDGTPRKLLDVSRIKQCGWRYETELELGIEKTYEWFLNNIKNIKQVKL